jgi:hypothetical protein
VTYVGSPSICYVLELCGIAGRFSLLGCGLCRPPLEEVFRDAIVVRSQAISVLLAVQVRQVSLKKVSLFGGGPGRSSRLGHWSRGDTNGGKGLKWGQLSGAK